MSHKDFSHASESFKRLNPNLFGGVAPASDHQPDTRHEPAGTHEIQGCGQGCRLVRVTSFRLHLADERNLWDKAVVDALVEAGLLVDDSPKHAKIEVEQVMVEEPEFERTEIVIEPLPHELQNP